jgi:pantetheine-phosphate adenylyltransferase
MPDHTARLAQACSRLIKDSALHAQLSEGARQTSAALTVQAMAGNILRYAVDLLDNGLVVFVYQRMLPYHQARFTAVSEALRRQGRTCVAVEVASFDGLTVQYARLCQAQVILRGLRALSDFEFELQIAHTNQSLEPEVETLFLATTTRHSFLSSSVVKEVARFGGDVGHMVPPGVARDLMRLFNRPIPHG